MPTVPVYGGQQVELRPLQTPMQGRVDVSSGLQSVARGLDVAGDVADRTVRRDAEIEANRIDEEITANWLKWQAENARNYQGEKADDFTVAAEEWWGKAQQEHAGKVSPLAAQQIGRNLARKRGRALAGVAETVNAEKERFADSKADAAALREIEFGIDSGDTAGAAQRVRDIVAQKAARKGWTPEQMAGENQRYLGAMHLSKIERMAETDAAGASAYYEGVKGELPLQVQNKIEQVLKGEADNQFATTFAAENAAKPLAEQLADAAKITDPERRKKTIAQIQTNVGLKRAAQQEAEAAASDEAWQLASQGRRVPESTLQRMNGRERAQLKDWLREKAKQAAEGTPVKTDWATYIDARDALARGEKVNLKALTTKLAGPQLEQLLDIQNKAASPGSAKQDSLMTDEQRIGQALIGLGIDKKKQPEAAGQFAIEVDRRARAASAAKGNKELTPDEKQAVIDSVALDKVYVDEWGRDPQKATAMLTPEEMQNAYVNVNGRDVKVSSVPMEDRRQIISALRATGRAATEQAIVELYLRGKAQAPAAPATAASK